MVFLDFSPTFSPSSKYTDNGGLQWCSQQDRSRGIAVQIASNSIMLFRAFFLCSRCQPSGRLPDSLNRSAYHLISISSACFRCCCYCYRCITTPPSCALPPQEHSFPKVERNAGVSSRLNLQFLLSGQFNTRNKSYPFCLTQHLSGLRLWRTSHFTHMQWRCGGHVQCNITWPGSRDDRSRPRRQANTVQVRKIQVNKKCWSSMDDPSAQARHRNATVIQSSHWSSSFIDHLSLPWFFSFDSNSYDATRNHTSWYWRDDNSLSLGNWLGEEPRIWGSTIVSLLKCCKIPSFNSILELCGELESGFYSTMILMELVGMTTVFVLATDNRRTLGLKWVESSRI